MFRCLACTKNAARCLPYCPAGLCDVTAHLASPASAYPHLQRYVIPQASTTSLITTYIYRALINALSAHMIHINLNMIFYTHVEHRPTKTIYIKYLKNKQKRTTNTHTHTHTRARAHTHTLTVTETGYLY